MHPVNQSSEKSSLDNMLGREPLERSEVAPNGEFTAFELRHDKDGYLLCTVSNGHVDIQDRHPWTSEDLAKQWFKEQLAAYQHQTVHENVAYFADDLFD